MSSTTMDFQAPAPHAPKASSPGMNHTASDDTHTPPNPIDDLGNGTHWQGKLDTDNILWLALNRADAGTNVLTLEVLEELETLLPKIHAAPPKGVVIYSSKANGFLAGADVKSFLSFEGEAQVLKLVHRGQALMDTVEALPCPTVAMIHGFCLGGGMELALACDYRIARDDDKTRLGLPEIKLGIHPGFGGTVRSIRSMGPLRGMDLMLTGRGLRARVAKKLGLVDTISPERHERRAAARFILKQPAKTRPRGIHKLANHALLRRWVARYLRKQVAKKARIDHYPAPYNLIQLWERHADHPKRMLEAEAESFSEIFVGDTAQNLIRLFLLQDRLKALGDKSAFSPKRVHVIGAGVMGGDIAAWCALRGLSVTLQDASTEALGRANQRAAKLFKRRLKQPRAIQAALDRLHPDPKGYGLTKADVIIEAIFENKQAKQDLYKTIEPQIREDALLTTNTSSIPLEELATVLKRPERLVGLHFFNPVPQMQLIEIVSTPQSDPTAVTQALSFSRHIERLPLPVRSSPGFLINRILMPYLLEAVRLIDEGVPAQNIDQAALEFGMPMGPVELADTVGLDICLSVASGLSEAFGETLPPQLQQHVDAKQLGRKSGQGFYLWHKGKPRKPAVEGKIDPSIGRRMVLRALNEAAACLREGVINDADLLDAGMVFGTGFAPFRGGPMHYAEVMGINTLSREFENFEQQLGSQFKPDSQWGKLQSS